MLTLVDLGAEYWRNYHGTGKDALKAYELTIERLDWYRRETGRMVVCCDSPKSIRRDKHEIYKAHREPKPPEAIDSLVSVQRRVAEWGVPVVMVDGYEGDDIIATLADQAFPEEVQIIGSEKDFYCLIDDRVTLVGRLGRIRSNECWEKFGVLPSQMTDWLVLVGDASDGIPGCPNCGPGRASDLLNEFESLAGIMAATDKEILAVRGVGKKTLDSLRAWDSTMAYELARLMTDAPIDLFELFKGDAR